MKSQVKNHLESNKSQVENLLALILIIHVHIIVSASITVIVIYSKRFLTSRTSRAVFHSIMSYCLNLLQAFSKL